ncbi:MAG: site-specific DNA-methyltransferase [Phycisphaerae bacterium]|nr:site-specific DNA-methyltransferase [Phycisphaerae bacterium]
MLALNSVHAVDALTGLRQVLDHSIDCVMTSPPYWATRRYGVQPVEWNDGQRASLGLEPNSDQYLDHLIEVFDEIARVLKPTGTLWVNLGDCYGVKGRRFLLPKKSDSHSQRSLSAFAGTGRNKSLFLIPERFAIRMVERGWTLRSKVVWHKTNHMPCSSRDRLACSWESLFLFTRGERYFFDLDAIREPHASPDATRPPKRVTREILPDGRARIPKVFHPLGKNPGDVWRIPTRPSPTDHPASFPEALCVRPIAAGCPPEGIVLDPFAGSGTTLVVAKRMARRYIGLELNPSFAQSANGRLAALDHELKGGARRNQAGHVPGAAQAA